MPTSSLLLTAALAVAAPGPALERIHVSPQGSDQGTGRPDAPFATLARARDAVRAVKQAGLRTPVEVVLAAGTYYLREPLVLTPADSGTAACPITWTAAPGARVLLSGGVPVEGFRRQADGLWAADVDARRLAGCRLVRIGERWATRARWPHADPAQPITGGWLFAQFGGEPWERGAFGAGVANTHAPGTSLGWRLRIPADGAYRVWLRYGHKMRDYNAPDMAGRTVFSVDGGPDVPLVDLPDTGGWDASRWAACAELKLTAGEHQLKWINRQGGGINLDAFALCTDPAWEPTKAIGKPTWWGAADIQRPAAGQHLLIVQAEACDSREGKELSVGQPTPPGVLTHVTYAPGSVPRFADPTGAEVHIFIAWGWVNAIVPLARIDHDQRRLVFPAGGAAQDVRMGNRFFIENVREGLAAPGAWYLDEPAGKLFYRPTDDRAPSAVAAVLDRLIELRGDPAAGQFVEHVRFAGLRFGDTTYRLTRDYYTPSDAAVHLNGARHCALTNCEFAWCGGYAVQLGQRSEQVEIRRCHLHDMGQGGVHLVGGTKVQPHHCTILGNTIERIGLVYKHVAGVYVTHGSDNRIAHNRITDTPRYAVSLKSQGEDRLSHRNIVEYNEMLRTNLETNDTGAFESLGYEHRDSGNIVRYNLILDSVGLLTTPDGVIHTPHFTWGIYLDDYSSGTTVYGNIVARNVVGGVCVHGGQNNRIENNIFVDSHEHQVRLQPRDAFMQGNTFARNIVAYRRPEAQLVFCWNNRRDLFARWDHNLYWLRGADLQALTTNLTPQGPWPKWLAAGNDAHSVVADPLFVDPARDDYRLRPDSPAWALGFKPIPVERIGPAGAE